MLEKSPGVALNNKKKLIVNIFMSKEYEKQEK